MKYQIVLSVMTALVGLRAMAVEDLEQTCANLLDGPHITIHGRLVDFWVPGSEQGQGQIAWAILDDDYSQRKVAAALDVTFILRSGDRVDLLKENGDVQISGYFGIEQVATSGEVSGRVQRNFPTVPTLYRDRQLQQPMFSSGEFMVYFAQQRRARVTHFVSSEEKNDMRNKLLLQYEAYAAHIKNENRFIEIGGVPYELAHFESVRTGQVVVQDSNLYLRANDQTLQLHRGEQLFLLNRAGDVVFSGALEASQITPRLQYWLDQSQSAVAIVRPSR